MTTTSTGVEKIAQVIERFTGEDGMHTTAIDRLELYRTSTASLPQHTTYQPALCIIAQGEKQVTLGDQTFCYDDAHYLVASVDLPAKGCVTQASPEKPYLSIRLNLDMQLLNDVLLSTGVKQTPKSPSKGLEVNRMSAELVEATHRLLVLLDKPEDVQALAPVLERELLYWLVKADKGAILAHLSAQGSHFKQILKAIQCIKAKYAEPFEIKPLLNEVGMSQASFFQHFKAVTNMTPLQYQKQLRLQEARRLVWSRGGDISGIGYQVGYNSPSQFCREYTRHFGLSPSKDIEVQNR